MQRGGIIYRVGIKIPAKSSTERGGNTDAKKKEKEREVFLLYDNMRWFLFFDSKICVGCQRHSKASVLGSYWRHGQGGVSRFGTRCSNDVCTNRKYLWSYYRGGCHWVCEVCITEIII